MSHASKTVLICDDQPILRKLLSSAVEDYWGDVKIIEAKNGLEGEGLSHVHDFDVIFMGVEMRHQNGVQTLENLSRAGFLKNTPVVMCTGCSGELKLVQKCKPRVDYFLEKPFDVKEIDAVLDEIKGREYEMVS